MNVMKKTKIILFAFTMVFFVTITNAQTSFGIKAGFNLANVSMSSFDTKSIPSFHVGGLVDIAINDFLSVQPNLLFTGKGYKVDYGNNFPGEGTSHYYYLELPVLVKAYAKLGGLKIYGAAGPSIAMGITGKDKGTYFGTTTTSDIKFGSNQNMNLFDFGIMFGAGIETESGFLAGISYDLGLTGQSIKNRVFGISIGYLFGK